ncbi:MAG: hypothetical protein JW797_07280 [Bradymonadales bacterium]|nr:hypothetical protein [Bradymonadales bacterium]
MLRSFIGCANHAAMCTRCRLLVLGLCLLWGLCSSGCDTHPGADGGDVPIGDPELFDLDEPVDQAGDPTDAHNGPETDPDAAAIDLESDLSPDLWDLPFDLPPGTRVTVRIDPSIADGALDPRYIGFALDTAQLTGGMWWRAGELARSPAETPDLEDPRLIRLVSHLAPSLLRIGGTDCDAVYFCPEAGECQLPEPYRDAFLDENRLETVLTHEDVRRTADFAAAVGANVLFCVNMGPGPRDPETGAWRPDNARQLIRFATSLDQGAVFAVWEPGNEINSFSLNFRLPILVSPERFAQDLVRFAELVEEESASGLVSAPGSYVSPFGELQDFTPRLMAALAEEGAEPLDALSWHLYATQSTSCPAQIHPADNEHLFAEWMNDSHRALARSMRQAAGDLPVWNTESASAQCGGQEGISDSMADALWYADWLGLLAQEGTSLVIRHSMVGADYSLLEPDTFEPRPTFLALVLMRRLAARAHLATEVDRTLLKAHGWCAPESDRAITAVLANPGSQTLVAEIVLEGLAVESAEGWLLETGGDLAGKRAAINGQRPGSDGAIPAPAGTPLPVTANQAWVEVPPASLAFVRLQAEAPVAGCR